MSNAEAALSPLGLGYSRIVSRWGWFVGLGVVLLLLGILALGDVVATSLVSVIFIGAMILVAGVFQIGHALATRGSWRNFLFGLAGGLLYLIGGALIMREPVQGSVIITLFVLVALVIGGVLRSMLALRHRDLPGWWLMLLGGVLSVVVGIVLYMALPWSGLWVLGTLIGVELIVQGLSWLRFGFALRSMRRQ